MEWPTDMTQAFVAALDFPPPIKRPGRVQYLLDRAAMCAVWRARVYRIPLIDAYSNPRTPIAYLTGNLLDESVSRLVIRGDRWNDALVLLHRFVRGNVAAILTEFAPQATEYPCGCPPPR